MDRRCAIDAVVAARLGLDGDRRRFIRQRPVRGLAHVASRQPVTRGRLRAVSLGRPDRWRPDQKTIGSPEGADRGGLKDGQCRAIFAAMTMNARW
jgi:hypothetical protein